jgi:hypothetical protein
LKSISPSIEEKGEFFSVGCFFENERGIGSATELRGIRIAASSGNA